MPHRKTSVARAKWVLASMFFVVASLGLFFSEIASDNLSVTRLTRFFGGVRSPITPALKGASTATMNVVPLAGPGLPRSPNDMLSSLLVDSPKSGLNVTRVPISRLTEVEKSEETFDESFDTPDGNASVQSSEVFDEPTTATSDASGALQMNQKVTIAPVLIKNKQTGALDIGDFRSMSLLGNTAECLDTGYLMLRDIGISRDHLKMVLTSPQITIAKICANNGSIVFTCRGGRVVISPRRARPDDNCVRLG